MSNTSTKKLKKQIIPNFLIYEMDRGKPIYYWGYEKVLNKTKTAKQIIGSSALQSLVITLILKYLGTNLKNNYLALSSKLGFKLKKDSWRSLDIAIFDLNKIRDKTIFFKNNYIKISPEVIIEIDTKANLGDLPYPSSYFQKKTDQLLKRGVLKVIWIFTATQKVLVAEKSKPWIMDNWAVDVEVIDGIAMNVVQILNDF